MLKLEVILVRSKADCEVLNSLIRGCILFPLTRCKVQEESACSSSSWGKDKWVPALISASNQRARTNSHMLWFNICIYDIMVQWQLSSKQRGPNANPVWHRTLTDHFGTILSSGIFGFLMIKGIDYQAIYSRGLEDGVMTIIQISFQLKRVPWSLVLELWDMYCTVTQEHSKNEVYL